MIQRKKLLISESRSVMSDSLEPHRLYSPWNSPARILEWVAFLFWEDLPNLEIELRSPALQVDSLPAEPQGKPKNTGVGSLSLLQQSHPGIEPGSPALRADSLLTELKLMNFKNILLSERNKTPKTYIY